MFYNSEPERPVAPLFDTGKKIIYGKMIYNGKEDEDVRH